MRIAKAAHLYFDESNYIHDSVVFIFENEYSIQLGKNNHIMPGSVIKAGTGYREATIIGDNNYIGPSCVIDSDSLIGNNNKIIGNSLIGVHASVLNNVLIEHSASISNYTTVGSFSSIGTLTPINKDVKPFSKVFGNPPSLRGVNMSKAIKEHFSESEITEIEDFIKRNKELSEAYLISIVDEFYNQSRKKHYDYSI